MTSIEQAQAAVAAARAVLGDAGAFASAPRDELIELLARVAELSRVADGLQVHLAHAVEERSQGPSDEPLCALLGARNAKEAVANAFGLGSRRALDLLAMSRATSRAASLTGADIPAKYPAVAGALAEGDISFAQAHAIISTLEPAASRADLDQLAICERALVDAATDPRTPLVPELLVVQARAYAAVLDPDGVLPNDERQRALRSVRMRQLPDGSWDLFMRCTPESGAAIKAVLDAHTGPRVKVAFRDADAPDTADEASLDDRTPAQKRHDVLLALVQAHAASGAAPAAGGEPPVLVFSGSIDAYAAYVRGVAHAERTLTIEHTFALVPIERVDQLVCDARIQHTVVSAVGHPLALGRAERLFSRAQRRALAQRDRGCRVPGCGMPVAWCEAHHIVPWQLGGATDVDNGILVCNYHHHEIHAGRLLVEPAAPEAGIWRIVPQLQPARRSHGRLTEAVLLDDAAAAVAANAPAPLAVKINDSVVQPRAAALPEAGERSQALVEREVCAPARRRGARGAARADAAGGSSVEMRLRRRLGGCRSGRSSSALVDHGRRLDRVRVGIALRC
ncbi:HNH endonuclease signature motif containing protein [Agrococcus sp. HG114]|uniref:HNH endonuclease signature motif containing protein n=1 Tax=Agrococcus sp. HG114 TaxID=2969757 RepID=UPI00215A1BA7|nr:HNH endonuclease signature motif containing protein [Agrococcus sp. HG114]MCR8669761.1 HNH endonuclease [Agrococcus sp. HG114]